MVQFHTSMTLSDLDKLDTIFAYLTDTGWIVPSWLTNLRNFYIKYKRD